MVRVGKYPPEYILNEDFFFVWMLYEKLEEEIKEENQRRIEENKEQERMYAQQQDYFKNNAQLPNYNDMKLPSMPNFPNF